MFEILIATLTAGMTAETAVSETASDPFTQTAQIRTLPKEEIKKRVTTTQAPQRAIINTLTPSHNFHDPDSIGWQFRYGLSSDAYGKAWNEYKGQGYLPIDIETDRVGTKTRFSGVWQKNKDNRKWASYRNLDSKSFGEKWKEYKDKGYRLIDQDMTMIGGKAVYSMVMIENKEGLKWVSNRNLTSQQFSENFNKHKGNYKPIDVDATQTSNGMRYSIIWLENKPKTQWAEYRDMSPAGYGDKFKEYSDKGYRVSDLDCYKSGGKLKYAAIWEKNQPGRAWAARREMSGTAFQNWWKKYRDQGMRIVDVEVCPGKNGSGTTYAAVWRENADRYDWAARKTVENALKNYVDNSDAPGVGAAVVRNGQVLFRGGAGDMDTQKGVWAHGGTIYRLASIAKAVTGTLAYDMEDDELIDLDVQTRTLVSGLGSNHTHTVRELVRMEGCVTHYQGGENNTQTQFATQQSALDNHMNGAFKTNTYIRNGCTDGSYNYSTHSYTLAGAALEAEGGMSFAQLVKTRIADPIGLSTLRVENRSSPAPSGERAEVYDGNSRVSNSAFQNITWKAGGGGLESSAVDLARYGDAVLRNRYFDQTVRDAMWTGTQNGRAAGWGMTGNQRWKPGGQQASDTYIVVDAGTNTTVVVMTNQSSASIDSTTLANQILAIANAN